MIGIVAVAVIFVVLGLVVLSAPKATVKVSEIRILSSANACDVNGDVLSGFTADLGAAIHESLTIHNSGVTNDCTLHSVVSDTPGFTVSGANTPLVIPPRANGTLSFGIATPTSSFTGSLALDIE